MNVDEALRRLADPAGFPKDAMEWALAHWDEAAPRFIGRLRAWAARGAVPPEAAEEAFFILHLCGDKGEAGAYEPLCRLIASGADPHPWLGDAVTETLPGILIKLFDGEAEPLVRVIESPKGDAFAQSSALAALAYLVRARGAMNDEDMRGLLHKLSREAKPSDDMIFWMTWAEAAAKLGYEDLRADLARLNAEGRLERREYDLAAFNESLEAARRNPGDLAIFELLQAVPFEDAIGTLEKWDHSDEPFDEESFADQDAPFDAPYVNPLRDVGRNDPCPCGSGKKYKKCCLAA